ncbi:MAG: hypothetical protein ACRDG4_02075, partial [Chloroflexota bacterium]
GYHRDGRGSWVRWPGGQSGALFSEVLGLTLEIHDMLLRPRDRFGVLLPTQAEERDARVAETRRAHEEATRADIEARRADIETRRAQSAEARAAALEAELARLRQDS